MKFKMLLILILFTLNSCITRDKEIAPIAISISSSGWFKLWVSQTHTFRIYHFPFEANPSVSWHSSDVNIVDINQKGELLAIKEGIVTITARSTIDSKVSASILVTINPKIYFAGHEWLVLSRDDTKALIISKDIIEQRPYHSSSPTTWETSDIRHYLNNQFLERFSEADKSRILETVIINENNQVYGTNGGNNTSDKVFLLSIYEALLFFGEYDKFDRHSYCRSKPQKRIFENRVAYINGFPSWWWLRSPGYANFIASVTCENGIVRLDGYSVNISTGGVRPSMWIDLLGIVATDAPGCQ